MISDSGSSRPGPAICESSGLCQRRVSTAGGWFLFPSKPARPYFLTASVVLVLFGFVAPSALEIVYIAWMSLGFTMGLLRNHTFKGKDIRETVLTW